MKLTIITIILLLINLRVCSKISGSIKKGIIFFVAIFIVAYIILTLHVLSVEILLISLIEGR